MPEQIRDQNAVLLIEDDLDVALGASLRLRSAGYQTLIAHDGHEGVSVARSKHPDAIVLDVRMPRMNGLKALKTLQHDQSTRDIPIVMLSASLVDRRAALDAGARYFLTKPYQPVTLVTAVEKAIAETHHV
jgi:CheY-like chemotaxis protein